MNATHLITPRECAERLGVHPSTVTRWVRDGHLPAWRIAGTTRIDWDEVVHVLVERRGEVAERAFAERAAQPSAEDSGEE